ncbi:TauD/TfdA family dioxygenase [Kitasatospora sp. NPDC093558]|uniref:TauD/TfdA family dioxygenase n=1 Tax=Kitasatospora sp. NPDC093558 TaxID=3155201 RepID=UPI00342D1B6F
MDAPVAVGGPSAWWGVMLEESDWVVPVDRVAERLRHGPGFAVVRGFDLDALTDDECVEVCRRFVALQGVAVRPVDLTLPGHNLLTADGSRDDAELGPHTDRGMSSRPARLLGLLCVRPARSGGESVLVSGHAVHDVLLGSRPEVLPTLYGEFHFGDGPGYERVHPVFRRGGDRLDVQYNRYWITRGRLERGEKLTDSQVAALDAFDEVMADPRLTLRLQLRRGDLLLVDNLTVLHGRTAFVDPPEPEPGRCLARVWAD